MLPACYRLRLLLLARLVALHRVAKQLQAAKRRPSYRTIQQQWIPLAWPRLVFELLHRNGRHRAREMQMRMLMRMQMQLLAVMPKQAEWAQQAAATAEAQQVHLRRPPPVALAAAMATRVQVRAQLIYF